MGKKAAYDETQQQATVLLELPSTEVEEEGYAARMISVRLESQDQARGMKRLLTALQKQNATTKAKGRTVKNNADAIRWFLETYEASA